MKNIHWPAERTLLVGPLLVDTECKQRQTQGQPTVHSRALFCVLQSFPVCFTDTAQEQTLEWCCTDNVCDVRATYMFRSLKGKDNKAATHNRIRFALSCQCHTQKLTFRNGAQKTIDVAALVPAFW
jgi:hypothetical protein